MSGLEYPLANSLTGENTPGMRYLSPPSGLLVGSVAVLEADYLEGGIEKVKLEIFSVSEDNKLVSKIDPDACMFLAHAVESLRAGVWGTKRGAFSALTCYLNQEVAQTVSFDVMCKVVIRDTDKTTLVVNLAQMVKVAIALGETIANSHKYNTFISTAKETKKEEKVAVEYASLDTLLYNG